jgi:hypothetical protein
LIVGLLLGLVGGLIFTWFVMPLRYFDTYPPMMAARYRQDWIRMATWSYGLDGNWERTQTRLLNLPPSEIAAVSTEALERAAAEGRPAEILQRIAGLALAYGASGPGVSVYAEGDGALALPATEQLPSPTVPLVELSPTETATPRPQPTPRSAAAAGTATPPALTMTDPISIVSQTLTCELEPILAISLEMSQTVSIRGRETQGLVGLPMREIWLIWDDGADRAITGLRPQKGLGYADFAVVPDRTYNLYIDSPSGRPILTLQVEPCPPAEGTGWVSRMLILREALDPLPRTTGDSPVPPLTVSETLTLSPTLRVLATPSVSATPSSTPSD